MSTANNHTPPLAQDSTLAALQFHPLAQTFPLMEDAELKALAADIDAHGLVEPIILYENQILDGRNRYRACREAGVEPTYRPFMGDDPFAFVVSANLHRRHLTIDQKRDLAAKLLVRDPRLSDRQIGKMVGLSKNTAADVRYESEGRGQFDHVETRIDTKGRKQPAKKLKLAPRTPHPRRPWTPRPSPTEGSSPTASDDQLIREGEAAAAEYKRLVEAAAVSRDRIIDEFFALASGGNILQRIRAAKRNNTVIADFLDALGVEGMRAAMSPEFEQQLRAALKQTPAPAAPASNSDNLEIPLCLRRNPPRLLN